MDCIICGGYLEPWPGGMGYGNNPAPWPNAKVAAILMERDDYRCCNDCNSEVVVPMRLHLV